MQPRRLTAECPGGGTHIVPQRQEAGAANNEYLAGRVLPIHAQNKSVDQIVDIHRVEIRGSVADEEEQPAPHQSEHLEHARIAGTIDGARPNDDDLQPPPLHLRPAILFGKQLGFLAQELGREVNTIGSKANDAEISQEVVEIKTALERVREQLQNVE